MNFYQISNEEQTHFYNKEEEEEKQREEIKKRINEIIVESIEAHHQSFKNIEPINFVFVSDNEIQINGKSINIYLENNELQGIFLFT